MRDIELKPCPKCRAICSVTVVQTMANKYRVGCTIHSIWQENGYDSIDEAVDEWNRRSDNEQRETD